MRRLTLVRIVHDAGVLTCLEPVSKSRSVQEPSADYCMTKVSNSGDLTSSVLIWARRERKLRCCDLGGPCANLGGVTAYALSTLLAEFVHCK